MAAKNSNLPYKERATTRYKVSLYYETLHHKLSQLMIQE